MVVDEPHIRTHIGKVGILLEIGIGGVVVAGIVARPPDRGIARIRCELRVAGVVRKTQEAGRPVILLD